MAHTHGELVGRRRAGVTELEERPESAEERPGLLRIGKVRGDAHEALEEEIRILIHNFEQGRDPVGVDPVFLDFISDIDLQVNPDLLA